MWHSKDFQPQREGKFRWYRNVSWWAEQEGSPFIAGGYDQIIFMSTFYDQSMTIG